MLRRGEWELATPRVLRLIGSERTDGQRLSIAVLDVGQQAALSHRTAAAWWDLPGFALEPIEVTRPRGPREPGYVARIHEVRTLRPQDVTELHGVPVMRPERLALELFATENPLRAERACETMWARRLWSGPSLRAFHDRVGGRGVDGTVALRAYLDERPDDYVPPASGLEARFARILADAGEPPMRRQVDSGGDRWVGRVDFRDAELPVIVEIQSERYHTALIDAQLDEERLETLRAAGFVVVPIWDVQVWHDPRTVVDLVHKARLEAHFPNWR